MSGWIRYIILTSIIFLSLSVLIYGCGNSSEIKKLKDQIATMEKEKDELNREKKMLEDDLAKFKERCEKQQEEINALKRRLTDAGISETPEEENFEVCKENLKKIAQALKLYATDNQGLYPKKLDEKIYPNPKYLEIMPICPSTAKDYSGGYEVSKDKKSFTVYCLGSGHSNINIKENYPQYSSERGLIVEKEVKKTEEE